MLSVIRVSDFIKRQKLVRTGLDEASTKRHDLFALERNVGYSVGNRDAVDLLPEVLVRHNVRSMAGLAGKRIWGNTELLLKEGLSGILWGACDAALGEWVVYTNGTVGLKDRLRVVALELSALGTDGSYAVGGVANGRIPAEVC
jgi:hypothetical protein